MKAGWWALAIALPFIAAALFALLGCGPVQTPTPAGLVVFYSSGEKRLSREKAAELDARYKALRECLLPESLCQTEPPTFAIDHESPCDDWFWDGKVKVRGFVYLNGTHRIKLPRSLGAAAHELVHYHTCIGDHPDREVYKTTLPATCGDTIDAFFRRMYPPRKCEEA